MTKTNYLLITRLKKLQDRELIILEQEFKNNPQAILLKKPWTNNYVNSYHINLDKYKLGPRGA